ncbi:MAG: hypothetical protein KF701_08585 [Anaerolineales bacterium]|nr:MAG: hypothetical protein KF701_08585 [Anaerolineales bacterium]
MPNSRERMEILQKLERGEITLADAEKMLSGLMDIPRPAPPTRMGILEQVEAGTFSADEAAQQLLVQQAGAKRSGGSQRSGSHREDEQADDFVSFSPIKRNNTFGHFLFIAGLSITLLAALWMGMILQRSGLTLGFFCLWLPFAAGLLALVLGWAARNGEWMQLNVRSRKPGNRNVFISLPLPLSIIERYAKRGEAWLVINRDDKEQPKNEG